MLWRDVFLACACWLHAQCAPTALLWPGWGAQLTAVPSQNSGSTIQGAHSQLTEVRCILGFFFHTNRIYILAQLLAAIFACSIFAVVGGEGGIQLHGEQPAAGLHLPRQPLGCCVMGPLLKALPNCMKPLHPPAHCSLNANLVLYAANVPGGLYTHTPADELHMGPCEPLALQ